MLVQYLSHPLDMATDNFFGTEKISDEDLKKSVFLPYNSFSMIFNIIDSETNRIGLEKCQKHWIKTSNDVLYIQLIFKTAQQAVIFKLSTRFKTISL